MVVFLALLLSFMLYLNSYLRSTLLNTELAGLIPTTQKVSDQVDTLYKQIDYAALGFTSNQENLEVMVNLSSNNSKLIDDSYVAFSKMAHNLNAIYNVVSDLYKVVVFIPEKNIFYSYFRSENLVKTLPEIYSNTSQSSKLFRTDQLFTAFEPHPDIWSTSPENVISIVRKFRTAYNTDFGMVEIQLPYKSLQKITTVDKQTSDKQVLIFNESGTLIYPLQYESNKKTRK